MNLNEIQDFELRQICYFLTLVQEGNNFSEAAKRLQIPQSSVSRRIQALEKQLSNVSTCDVKLFNRKKKPILLTEAGKVFLEETQQAFIHLDRAVTQARQASRGEMGRIVLGLNNSIANSILPKVLQIFRSRFPKVEVEIQEVTIAQELQMLQKHQLDLIFQRSPHFEKNNEFFRYQPIFEEYFVVALPEHHALAQQSKISLHALRNESIILPPLNLLPFYEKIVQLCQQAGFEPKLAHHITVTGVVMLLGLVAAGLGISILPNHVETLQRKGVVYKEIKDTAPRRRVAAVWREEDDSVILKQFLNIIREVVHLPLPDSW